MCRLPNLSVYPNQSEGLSGGSAVAQQHFTPAEAKSDRSLEQVAAAQGVSAVKLEEMLNVSYGKYSRLMTIAERCFADGKLVSAVRLAEIAARFAFPGQVGLFASPRLERLLSQLGNKIPIDCELAFRKEFSSRRQVIHVMTYAKPLGGDSRFVWRWIQQDQESCHSVVITSQADPDNLYEIPDVLINAATQSGGYVKALKESVSDPLSQARELRVLCRGADIVLLHLYPYDVIPIIALSAGCEKVKIGVVNHADHSFWIGSSVAHWIIHLREQNIQFLKNRRGLDASRSSIVPIPLGNWSRRIDQKDAKKDLGYGPEVILLLTIASPFKFQSRDQLGFLDLVKPIIKEHPGCVLIAVGPKPEGEWLVASRETGGRIIAMGKRWDNEVLVAAADIYLDSIPFASITSVLEAGSHGIPALGLRAQNEELGLLSAGAPGLTDTMRLASDPKSYRKALLELLSDSDLRLAKGKNLRNSILSFHSGLGWAEAIQKTYLGMNNADRRKCLIDTEDRFSAGELNVALAQLYGDAMFRLQDLVRRGVGTLPYYLRLQVTFALRREGLGFCAINAVPPPLDSVIRRLARQTKLWMSAGHRFVKRCRFQ